MTAARRHEPVPGPMQRTLEWDAIRLFDPDRTERPVVFGASEAADICGVGYKSPLQVYLEKRKEIESWRPSEEQQDAIDFGTEVEPVILRLYGKRRSCDVRTNLPMFFHPSLTFMAASPDAEAQQLADVWTVDSKSAGFRMIDATGEDDRKYGAEGTDQVPLTALYQAQQLMEVCGTERCDFPVLTDRKLRIYTVPRSDELIAQIVSAEKELFERIINGDPPEPTYSHPGTRKLLKEMYGCNVGSVIELPTDLKDVWLHREALQLRVAELQEEIDVATNQILSAMGDAQTATFTDSNVKIKRIIVKDSVITQQDVDSLQAKVGQVGRKGHVRLQRVRSRS